VSWSVQGEEAPYHSVVGAFLATLQTRGERNREPRGRLLAALGVAELSEAAGLLDATAQRWQAAYDRVPRPPADPSADAVRSGLASLERYEQIVALQRKVWEDFLADWRSIGRDPCSLKRYIDEQIRPSISVGTSCLPEHRRRVEAAMSTMDDLDDARRECNLIDG
jgi:hypothetical protein